MSREAPRVVLSAKKRWAFRGITLGILTLTVFMVGEGCCRLMGLAPWDPGFGRLELRIEPGGTLSEPHPKLAYVMKPGEFTIHQTATWHTHQVGRFHRATSPDDDGSLADDGRESLWTFGDSNTYGAGLNDEQTYAWRLQERHPEFHVVNFGNGGYSTLQSLYQLEESLASSARRPIVATLAYASYHDGRNTLLRGNQKNWYFYREVYRNWPRAWLENGDLKEEVAPLDYSPWPLSEQSAFVNLLEEKYNKLTVLTSASNEVSRALIKRFDRVCRDNDIEFFLLGISMDFRTAAVLSWAAEEGITTLDMSVDQSVPENIVPGDGHPSAKSNEYFADKIDGLLAMKRSSAASVPPITPSSGAVR